MPIGGRTQVFHDTRPESKIRRNCWFWWVMTLTTLGWICWYMSLESPNVDPIPLVYPILITIGSIPIGWLLGYKLGFQVLLTGFYIFNKEPDKRDLGDKLGLKDPKHLFHDDAE